MVKLFRSNPMASSELVNTSKLTVPKRLPVPVTDPASPAQTMSFTALGNYRPYRRRKGSNREAPQVSRSTDSQQELTLAQEG